MGTAMFRAGQDEAGRSADPQLPWMVLDWPHVPPPARARRWSLPRVKPAAPHLLSEADWAQARAFLHGRLRRLLDRCDEAVVEDATQEAAVRLLRVMRREEVRNLEALMNDICRKTAIDIMRSNGRFRATFEPLDEQAEHVAIESTADPLERLEFAVLEFFRGRQAACYDLAVAYFNDRDWELSRRHGREEPRRRAQAMVALSRAPPFRRASLF